jgi:hypothetical protein
MTITSRNKRIQALAADFEAAWKKEGDLPDDFSNEQMDAAVNRTKVFADRILSLRGTDVLTKCLRARVFLWGQATSPEKFAEHANFTTEKALASLFRDLGADYPIGVAGPDAGVSSPPGPPKPA